MPYQYSSQNNRKHNSMPTPKYVQIKEYLKNEALKPEAVNNMPSVRTLMRRFNVAMVTVNQALLELEHEQVIIRRQGRGIMAARNPEDVKFPVEAQHTENILVAYPDYPSEQLWSTAFMIEQYAKQNGLGTVSYKTTSSTTIQMIADAARECPNCHALCIVPTTDRYSFHELEFLASLPFPVLLIDAVNFYDEKPSNLYELAHDPAQAGMLIADTLLANGHSRIGSIRNEPLNDYGRLKQNAMFKRLRAKLGKKAEVCAFSETIHSWDSSINAARKITEKNLDMIREKEITALVFESTPGAFAAIPLLAEAGLSVPEDITIISEGDSKWFEYSNPPLTVLRPDYSVLCRHAVEIALGKHLNEPVFYCPQEIVQRKSVSKINNPI